MILSQCMFLLLANTGDVAHPGCPADVCGFTPGRWEALALGVVDLQIPVPKASGSAYPTSALATTRTSGASCSKLHLELHARHTVKPHCSIPKLEMHHHEVCHAPGNVPASTLMSPACTCSPGAGAVLLHLLRQP
jgi:hypothetical protein